MFDLQIRLRDVLGWIGLTVTRSVPEDYGKFEVRVVELDRWHKVRNGLFWVVLCNLVGINFALSR